jgi:DNA-binding transcriptional LysR family regulator
MNTRDISAFIAVVDTGSIVQAAVSLHLTQPGVTRRVQSLETMLGVELLDRQSKPLKPTAAGREVYQKGRQLLHSVADLMTLGRANVEATGELRLGMPPFLAELALSTPVDRLRECFPKLGLRILAGWSPGLTGQVEQGQLDASVVVLSAQTPPPAGMTATAFGSQKIKVVAAPSLGLPSRLGLSELSAFPWVLSQDGCGMRRTLRRAMDERGLPCDVAVEAYGADLQLSLVARGTGIGLVTTDLLAASSYRDRLTVLTVHDFKVDVVAWLIHRALPPRLEAPMALLLEELTTVMALRTGRRHRS